MDHTTNYNLPQWEAADTVKRSDVNSAMNSIDAALAAAGTKIACGVYQGNSETYQTVSVGFTPKIVYVSRSDGFRVTTDISSRVNSFWGGMAMQGIPFARSDSGTSVNLLEVVDGGFRVVNMAPGGVYYVLNNINYSYMYFAIG